VDALKYFTEKESTFLQWKYLVFILATYAGFTLITWLNGPGNKPSVVGIKKCDPAWWGLFGTFFAWSLLMTGIAILIQWNEYKIKRTIDWPFTPCDFKFSLKGVLGIPIYAFITTFCSVLTGFTPAFVYVPFLYTMELQPE
jgi:hypothetical protein